MSLAKQVKEQFEHLPAGGVIASRTLHKLSSDSQQVDKAASRLYKKQGLNKLRNGLFYKPYKSKFFGDLPPREEEILRSIRKQHDAHISPSGAIAAYEMGLTHELPESIVYESDFRWECSTIMSFKSLGRITKALQDLQIKNCLTAATFSASTISLWVQTSAPPHYELSRISFLQVFLKRTNTSAFLCSIN